MTKKNKEIIVELVAEYRKKVIDLQNKQRIFLIDIFKKDVIDIAKK